MIPGLSVVPTDNLYKFIAIAGLVGVISMAVLEQIAFGRFIGGASDAIVATREVSRGYRLLLEDSLALRRDPVVWLRRRDSLNSQSNRVSDVFEQVEARYDVEKREYRFWKYVFLIFQAIGFSAWYTFVQKFQDAILRAEARKVGFPQRNPAKPTRRRHWWQPRRVKRPSPVRRRR